MLLVRGTVLGAPELAVLASAGLPRADVHADPRIVIVATGDELVAPDEPIEAWQVRRSNSHALRGALNLRGFQRVAEDHLARRPRGARERLVPAPRHARRGAAHGWRVDGSLRPRAERAARTRRRRGVPQGGAAPGQADLVRHRPVRTDRVRPAGQPVSALVCLLRYALPAIYGLLGARPRAPEHVPLGAAHEVKDRPWHFLPGADRAEPGARPSSRCRARRAARAISCRCSAPTDSSSCPRARANCRRASSRRCTGGDDARGEDNARMTNLTTVSRPCATGSAGRSTTCASR